MTSFAFVIKVRYHIDLSVLLSKYFTVIAINLIKISENKRVHLILAFASVLIPFNGKVFGSLGPLPCCSASIVQPRPLFLES